MGKEHHIKCHPTVFEKIVSGEKDWELRKNDRDYQTGDILWIEEWDPSIEEYTGLSIRALAGFILYGGVYGLPENMCIISLKEKSHYYSVTCIQ